MICFSGRFVTGSKMFGNFAVVVKAVYNMKMLCPLRALFGQVGSAAAAQEQHINFVLHCQQVVFSINRRGAGNCLRVTAGEHTHQRHIRVVLHSQLRPTA